MLGYCTKKNCARRFRCEDNNVDFTDVQPHYYHVRQVEPCHRLRLRPGWKILPTMVGYCSKTNCARRFRCEDNNVDFTHVQPHNYHVRQVEPCHRLR